MTGRTEQIWFRVGQVAALAALAVLGVLDLLFGLAESSYLSLTVQGGAEVACALAVAAVWLPAHRPGSWLLPTLALLAAICSLGVTYLRVRDLYPPGGSWGLAETAALLGLLFVVVRRSRPWLGLLAAPVVTAAVSTQPLSGGVSETSVILCLLLLLFAAGAMAAGGFVRLIERGRERELAAVRAEQRAEFARDLHDFIAHHVTGIVVQAQGAQLVAAHDPQRVLTALQQIERAGAETMASMRRIVGVLRGGGADGDDTPLAPLATITELGPLVDGFGAAGPPVARLAVSGDLDGLPMEISSSAHRVVMEALTNVRKHATGATVVDVTVRRTPDWLLVRVVDDGPPHGRPGHGFGLVGLTERVTALGGRIQAGPGIERGWVVDAGLPLHAADGPARQPRERAAPADGSMAR
jgi:signal transduction histidine kinase